MTKERQADQVIGQCSKNPRHTGHCMHGTIEHSTGGIHAVQKCCWCGHSERQFIQHPEHGSYAP